MFGAVPRAGQRRQLAGAAAAGTPVAAGPPHQLRGPTAAAHRRAVGQRGRQTEGAGSAETRTPG